MADEFKHLSAGTSLTQGEYEAVGGHVLACQETGDIVYASSGSQLSRLGKGAANTILAMGGSCVPAWTASPSVTDLTIGGGCITLSAATDIDLLDNNASALSFDASGKTGIIDIVTTNCSEGVTMSGTLGVTGVLTANAGVVVDNFTLDGTELDLSSGDFALDVAGDIEINADGGCVNFKDASLALAAIVNTSCVGELRIHEAANYIGLKPPALSADQTWTWPATKGSACEVLTCDGCGVLSWASAGGSRTVSGTTDNGIITFVNSGSTFVAESELKYNGAGSLYYSRAGTVQFDMVPTGGCSQAWALSARTDGTFRITNDTDSSIDFKIDGDGAITTARQPAFHARNSSKDCNVTGDGTSFTVEFDSEIFDQGADYNNTSDTFTAPVTGRYLLSSTLLWGGLTTGHCRIDNDIVTSNRTYCSKYFNARAGGLATQNTVLADMDACDTAYVRANVYGGAAVVDLEACSNYFSGMLLA